MSTVSTGSWPCLNQNDDDDDDNDDDDDDDLEDDDGNIAYLFSCQTALSPKGNELFFVHQSRFSLLTIP